jgi:hypothetical protein
MMILLNQDRRFNKISFHSVIKEGDHLRLPPTGKSHPRGWELGPGRRCNLQILNKENMMFLTSTTTTTKICEKITATACISASMHACTAVADVVRTTLGYRGMDKLIHDHKGTVTISNDGATVMKLLDIVHLAPKILVNIAKSLYSHRYFFFLCSCFLNIFCLFAGKMGGRKLEE